MSIAELPLADVATKHSVFHRILVATDFSKTSERAFTEALMIARENHAELSLVHVMNIDWRYQVLENPPEIDLEEQDAQERVKAFIHALAPDEQIAATLVRHGPVAQWVASLALQTGADLLVMGTRGRGGFSKLALGSTAEEVLRIAPCPVLTVGPRAEIAPSRNAFQIILFATDFGKASAEALKVALSLAQTRHAKLVLLHMTALMPATSTSFPAYTPAMPTAEDVQAWQSSSRTRCLRQLKECIPEGLHLDQQPAFVAGTELCPEGILTAAEQYRTDLIVMGANHAASPKMAAHIPWTAVHEVVRKAPCPVLTVAG